MTGHNCTLIAEKFNKANRAKLWKLRDYFGTLEHTYCEPTGALRIVTATQADILMEAGRNVYVDIPCDPSCPVAEYRRDEWGQRAEVSV